ncbi:MAG: hypothetical protein ACI89X_001177 [Planctomycetota bacterium]|jgi:hypothetical protein
MAKKRTPQTFEKRARERDKQMKRDAKKQERLARSASRRDGTWDVGPTMGIENPERLADEEAERQRLIREKREKAERAAQLERAGPAQPVQSQQQQRPSQPRPAAPPAPAPAPAKE